MVRRLAMSVAVLAAFVGGGCMNCERLAQNPTITSSAGQKLCARHRVPLITVAGWLENRAAFHDALYMQAVVEECNPNSILPSDSLQRTRRYSIPTKISYCLLCEKAVSENRARPDATRPPSWWTELTTGVDINKS
jgi:hypothetical protein